MAELMTRLREQAGALWGKAQARQRLVAVGGAGAVMLLLLFVIFANRGTGDYAPVVTRLRVDEAAEVVATLREKGVPYRLSQDGTTVLVPRSDVYAVRLDLAAQGLPRGGLVGFEAFDSTQLGMTDFERRMKYLRALSGELTRSIRQLDQVQDSRVHIVVPERSLFVNQDREPTASVLLELRPGSLLGPAQIRGITHLVARSVEGLRPENVTVLDTKGNVLSDALAIDWESTSQAQSLVQRRLQIRRAYEKELEQSLQALLEQAYGAGRAVARVSAEMDFDVTERTLESFSQPAGLGQGIVRSEQATEESYQGGGRAIAGGPPGVESNIPGYVGVDSDAPSDYRRTERVTNYEVNREQVHVNVAPGSITRLSVAVWVDAELDAAQEAKLADMVSGALGLLPERGDVVRVDTMRMRPAPSALASEPPRVVPGSWLPYAGIVGAIVVLAVAVALWSRRRRSVQEPPLQGLDIVLEPDEATLSKLQADTDDEAGLERRVSPEERRARHIRERLEALAKEKPEELARILRGWLAEE